MARTRSKRIVKEEISEKFTIRPPAFSSREAKGVVDGALRNYSKDLKKLQYRVIKDWMSKAKSGVIDYFDLVRGFKTGDVSRAHPYEVEFLRDILRRDKIINRQIIQDAAGGNGTNKDYDQIFRTALFYPNN